jgi:hypothetical protein
VGPEIREYSRGDWLRWPRDTLYPQKVDTNFSDRRQSLDITCSQTKATEFSCARPQVMLTYGMPDLRGLSFTVQLNS